MLQFSMYMHITCTCSVGTTTCQLRACMHAHTQMSQFGNVTAGYVHAHPRVHAAWALRHVT